MCELFAMSANTPTSVDKYLSLLMPRGGKIGPHADGWGVAYYEGRASRIFKDASPAAESRYLSILSKARFKSTAVVAHIRKANPAVVGRAMANTHPFEREWNGHSWVFAHNGKLPGIHEMTANVTRRYTPMGDTDSEQAFCMLLNTLAHKIECGSKLNPEGIAVAMASVVNRLAKLGEFNFILSNGSNLFVHAHTRLHVLEQEDMNSAMHHTSLLATAPLTDDNWLELPPGFMGVYQAGRRVGSYHA